MYGLLTLVIDPRQDRQRGTKDNLGSSSRVLVDKT